MAYEHPAFVTDEYYHVFNRGVAKQQIFHDEHDHLRFLQTLSFYRESKPETKLSLIAPERMQTILAEEPVSPLVEILAYCLMPNHFHLLLKQNTDGGISFFLQQLQNSYGRFYNTKRHRVGTIFQGPFKAVAVTTNEQLLHLSRYIHLNPVVARLEKQVGEYPWSSLPYYRAGKSDRVCNPTMILQMSGGSARYDEFVADYADYAISLHDYKDLLLDM